MEEGMVTTFKTDVNYPGQARKTVIHQTDGVSLDDLLQEFEDHLKGCGFYFQGHLTIIEGE